MVLILKRATQESMHGRQLLTRAYYIILHSRKIVSIKKRKKKAANSKRGLKELRKL